jgi:G3E family GTPase
MKTPVTLITGFLGSGKTTIISHLIDELQAQKKQVIYIKNEIGSENIDAQLMQGKHIQTKELLNGCICCTLVGPFMAAVDEIITQFHPDRIVIEASGAADPSAIALMISSHPSLTRDGVITIIDVVNFEGYQDLSQTARNQATFTDLIVFNKVELAELDRKQAVVGYVRELNPFAPILEAPQGRISPEVVFGISSAELTSLLQHFDQNHEHHHHLETDQLSSMTLEIPPTLTTPQLQALLEQLPVGVFRVKGVMKDPQGNLTLINKVGHRTEVTTLAENVTPEVVNKLVLIGFAANEWQDQVTQTFTSS